MSQLREVIFSERFLMNSQFKESSPIGDEIKGVSPSPDSARVPKKDVGISDALKNFDDLPDSAYVRLPVVQALKACSPATVWRMVKRGDLPAPRKQSERITAWNVGELRKALAA